MTAGPTDFKIFPQQYRPKHDAAGQDHKPESPRRTGGTLIHGADQPRNEGNAEYQSGCNIKPYGCEDHHGFFDKDEEQAADHWS